MSNYLFRLAPTPSGFLHKGNAFNFLLNWLYAKQLDAKILLRIDDLDATRSRPEYLEDIFATLDWLGLDWDLGPKDVADFQQHWSQNLRLPDYDKQLEYLKEKGCLFACDCTRKTLRDAGFSGVYPNICAEKNLPLTGDLPWRVRVPAGTIVSVQDAWSGSIPVDLSAAMGSFVLKTRDGIPAYQLASLCDDVIFGVTHVIRGQDLLPSTAAQLYLADLLQLDHFQRVKWYHHPLIVDAEGHKLSKSAGSESLQYLRQQNYPRAALLYEFATWLQVPAPPNMRKAQDLLPFLPPLFR
ncbi:MAG: glutamate--tRNA ligase family protein [Saprospiraceae bacterium]